MLRKINKSVAALAEKTKRPGLMDRFRLPHGDGDTELAAKSRSFGAALEDLELLAPLGLVVTKAALETMAKELLDGTGDQGTARAKQTGRRLRSRISLKEARRCRKTFDAIYGNVYEGNTAMLAEWKSVSHVPRSGGENKAGDGGKATARRSSGEGDGACGFRFF